MATTYHKRVGNYVFMNSIGRGAFAEVFKGVHQQTHEEVAIKMISRAKMKDEEVQIEKEIKILRELDHENIVKFLDYQKTTNHYYLIFEFCKHGDFEHFIRDHFAGKVPEFEGQKFIQQIIEGIKSMKDKNIVHRDLKLANILVSKDFILKLADFGLARYMERDDLLLRSMVGTPLNMDPLILERKPYTEKCDIWSLGVIFYQILVGKPPFNPGRGAHIEDLLQLVKKQPVTFPRDIPISDSFKDLVSKMLVYDNNKRMSFEELFKHEWITGQFKVEDPNQLATTMNLSATQLLQSVYDQKRINKKKDQQQQDKINNKAGAPNQVKKQQPQDPKVQKNQASQDNELQKASEKDKFDEMLRGVFLAKVYEIFKFKNQKLKEYIMKVTQMEMPEEKDEGQEDQLLIVQVLLMMDLLKLLKEAMMGKFSIIEEDDDQIIFEDDFKSLWQIIMQNKDLLEKLYTTEDAELTIPDLYAELKTDYLQLFEQLSQKLENKSEIFEKFKAHNLEQLILESLVQLSDHTAYKEYLGEENVQNIQQYRVCLTLCEYLVFRRNFKFAQFNITRKSDPQGEESKEIESVKTFPVVVKQFFKDNNTKFKLLGKMVEREDYKNRIKQIKSGFCMRDIDKSQNFAQLNSSKSDIENSIKNLHALVAARVRELEEKLDAE